ncbi:MAG: Uma2 family endonuclease, partial [Bacteroidota bacterium]
MSIIVQLPTNRLATLSFNRKLTAEEFATFCAKNPDLVVEREPDGKISIMTPVGYLSGRRESRLIAYLTIWAIENGLGDTASSSTGFTLPNGAVRSPDAVWISDERLDQLTEEELEGFPNLVPDFVAEIRSKSDDDRPLEKKMQDTWITQGVRLGWLIDTYEEVVRIYRADGSVKVLPLAGTV